MYGATAQCGVLLINGRIVAETKTWYSGLTAEDRVLLSLLATGNSSRGSVETSVHLSHSPDTLTRWVCVELEKDIFVSAKRYAIIVIIRIKHKLLSFNVACS